MAEKDFVKLKNVTKIYQMGEVQIRAVDGIDFSIDKGRICSCGRSQRSRKNHGFKYPRRHGQGLRRRSPGGRKGHRRLFPEAADGLPEKRHWFRFPVL